MNFVACFPFVATSCYQRPTCSQLQRAKVTQLVVGGNKLPRRCWFPVVEARLELVKICGITCEEDARMVCEAIEKRRKQKERIGEAIRFLLGVIFCSSSKRNVGVETARQIVKTANHFHTQVVGVFVHQDASNIIKICEQTGISIAQLHGEVSRQSLSLLPRWIECIPVVSVRPDGSWDTSAEYLAQVLGCWVLFDSPGGGTGKTFSWNNFSPPTHFKWILAGGIRPDNLESALSELSPCGVDISSGVCLSDGIHKSPLLVDTFLDLICKLHFNETQQQL
ncbi:hypothetical protein GAYE_PCTG52G1239 [Galdieria yellowstonensis]|uniref:phosphoribosylanthranilate isomerase n=1 Tax=Galdieria yellowstonensis TaxID=3028027 RepID=A0AAV9I4K8_9RHOD|nr:hypothetical protein GAYE_PCTG52G1239 [Galdieria yellowstonensis]